MVDKICFRCKKKLFNKEHHYEFVEKFSGNIIHVDYAHKKCWDDFLKQLSDTTLAQKMLRGLSPKLTELGILPPEKIIIK